MTTSASAALVRAVDRAVAAGDPASWDAAIDIAADPSGGLDEVDTAYLAERLAASGSTLSRDPHARDVASTGGPASLSTLLCPLVQVADGARVPKLAVPGRPAGGVDALGSIPGYRTDLTATEAARVLERASYAHFVAGGQWAPGDRTLFERRQQRHAQRVPSLVAASLLAKKLAVGLETVVLDVRVSPHGNFGTDHEGAAANAGMFERVAHLVGIRALCLLTDGTAAQQPGIGRGEALAALLAAVQDGPREPWLSDHLQDCVAMARAADAGSGRSLPPAAVLRAALAGNLVEQGASLEALIERVRQVQEQPSTDLVALEAGTAHADLGLLRDLVLGEQRQLPSGRGFPDPAGVTLLVRPGRTVGPGDRVARVRCAQRRRLSEFGAAVSQALRPHVG